MLYRAAVLLALLVSACAPPGSGPTISTPYPGGVTLCVTNATVAMGSVTARGGGVTWHVQPGQRECKVVRGTTAGTIRLDARTLGGGIRGPLRESEMWFPGGHDCWEWRLHEVVGASSLTPCGTLRDTAAMDSLPRMDGEWMQVNLHEGMLGFTVCKSRPTSWVRTDVLFSSEGAATVAHEMAHAAIVERDGGCAAHWARARADVNVRINSEAEAYCVGARVWARQHGTALEIAIQRYAVWLASYGFGLSPAQAADRIRRFCTPA